MKDLDQVPHVPEDDGCKCMLCTKQLPYYRHKDGGVEFDLGRYLRDQDEKNRKDAWERIFGRKEKFD